MADIINSDKKNRHRVDKYNFKVFILLENVVKVNRLYVYPSFFGYGIVFKAEQERRHIRRMCIIRTIEYTNQVKKILLFKQLQNFILVPVNDTIIIIKL